MISDLLEDLTLFIIVWFTNTMDKSTDSLAAARDIAKLLANVEITFIKFIFCNLRQLLSHLVNQLIPDQGTHYKRTNGHYKAKEPTELTQCLEVCSINYSLVTRCLGIRFKNICHNSIALLVVFSINR